MVLLDMQVQIGQTRDNEYYFLEGVFYDPIGNPDSPLTNTDIHFTGEFRDATTGLQFHRARYYDPSLGVWISLDPLETPNRYGYVEGNPIMNVDPSGLQSESELLEMAIVACTAAPEACVVVAALVAVPAAIWWGSKVVNMDFPDININLPDISAPTLQFGTEVSVNSLPLDVQLELSNCGGNQSCMLSVLAAAGYAASISGGVITGLWESTGSCSGVNCYGGTATMPMPQQPPPDIGDGDIDWGEELARICNSGWCEQAGKWVLQQIGHEIIDRLGDDVIEGIKDLIRPEMKSRWQCTARCNLETIPPTPPSRCSGRVTGIGTGNSESEACNAAKNIAQGASPSGCYSRHCHCRKQDCFKI